MNPTVLMLFFQMILLDVLLIATPWLMPQTECFAVTVPQGARNTPPLCDYQRAYALRMGLVSLLCILAWPLLLAMLKVDMTTNQGSSLLAAIVSITMLIPIVASFALMLHYRRLVQGEKAKQGWHAEHTRSAAFVGPEDFPQPISFAWNLLYIPLIVAMTVFALVNYHRFPNMLPMHINLDGNVVDYAPKSWGTVLFPVYTSVFLSLVFAGAHWMILNSKRPIDPNAPASSALAYGRFARMMSQLLVVGGLTCVTFVGVVYYASALGAIPLSTAALVLSIGVIAFVVVIAIMSLRLGQAGARVCAAPQGMDMSRDDDAHWLLGTFYYNRDDPSLFVPKRFGIGWTFNMGSKAAWIAFVALILLAVGFSWASSALMS